MSLERRNNLFALHQGVIAEIRVVIDFKWPWWKLGTPQHGSHYSRQARFLQSCPSVLVWSVPRLIVTKHSHGDRP